MNEGVLLLKEVAKLKDIVSLGVCVSIFQTCNGKQFKNIRVLRVSQLNCVRGVFPLGINLGRRDAIFNHVSTTRSPWQRKVT